jgi:P27 family predicted phage terminase small subunit
MNKLPPELKIVSPSTNAVRIDAMADTIAERIPQAEWMDNPDAWDKKKFVQETSEFLHQVYGINTFQDRHALAMLADHIDMYVQCNKALETEPLIIQFNGGKTFGANPHFAIRTECLKRIIVLMNELGLTPKGRLSRGKNSNSGSTSVASKLLRGAKG